MRNYKPFQKNFEIKFHIMQFLLVSIWQVNVKAAYFNLNKIYGHLFLYFNTIYLNKIHVFKIT